MVGTGDIARTEHQGFTAKALKIRRFGAERHCFGTMAGQSFGHADQFGVLGLLERRHFGEQRRVVDLDLMALGDGVELLLDRRPQHLRVHARQRPQVKFHGALAADPVGVVAAVDAAEVQGRLRHGELRVTEFTLPLQAQAAQFAHGIVHGFQRAVAQARIGRMAAAPENVDALHHDAFVHPNWLEAGRLTDHRCPPQGPAGIGQGPGAGHGAFFVTGGEDQQRLLERLVQQRLERFDGQGEKALHVTTAQADPTAIDLGELQRIGLPQRAVERHRVTVAGQHQAAGTAAETGQQIEFARADLLDIAGEPQLSEPAGQQLDDSAVGLVEPRLGTADRRRGDQGSELIFHGRQRHRWLRAYRLVFIIEPSGPRNKPRASQSCTLHGLGSHTFPRLRTRSLDFPAMQKETEIKLRVSRETLAALREHPLLKKRNKSGWERHELMNQYFDTPERDLARAKVALRLRRDGEEVIQTLKTRGQSVAGLSERNEYDWHLPKAKLDLKKLDGECWPEALAELDKKTLKAIFTTDFVRERAEIAWGRGKSKVVIEAALDLGHVVVGKQKEEICELELELREGEPAALLELAAELAMTLPLMPCDISKAERGYRLHDAGSYALSLPAPQLTAETPLDDAFAALSWHLLGSSQRLAEQYRFNGHWRLLQDWVESLAELRALLSSLGQAAPRQSTHDLRLALDALLEDWRPLVQAGLDDEDVRKAAPEQFLEELQDPRWGLFSLNTSRWLLARSWAVERNTRGNRQGAAQLGSWLPRLLGEESSSLQLQRYQQQPEDLAEQLPRIERIQAWLHHARHVLEIPEMDRLYGELNKLAQLANQPITDETLDARKQQAIAVYQNRAWKTLLRL